MTPGMREVKIGNGVQDIILKFDKKLPQRKITSIQNELKPLIQRKTFNCLGDIGRWVGKTYNLPHSKYSWVLVDAN
jgi:hypothetical protein